MATPNELIYPDNNHGWLLCDKIRDNQTLFTSGWENERFKGHGNQLQCIDLIRLLKKKKKGDNQVNLNTSWQ